MDSVNERSVYKLTQAFEIKEQRIVAIDAHANVVALGDKKGHVFSYEDQKDPSQLDSQSIFESLKEGQKRGSGEITQITNLPRCQMIALLSSNVINVVQSIDLSTVQEIKNKKVHLFCINKAVYSKDLQSQNQLLMDQLCVVTTDKTLMFYEMQTTTGLFKFEEDRNYGQDKNQTIGKELPS